MFNFCAAEGASLEKFAIRGGFPLPAGGLEWIIPLAWISPRNGTVRRHAGWIDQASEGCRTSLQRRSHRPIQRFRLSLSAVAACFTFFAADLPAASRLAHADSFPCGRTLAWHSV